MPGGQNAMIQAQVDELSVLGEQAETRLTQLAHQQGEFVDGCERLFKVLHEQVEGMKGLCKQTTQLSSQVQQDLASSEKQVRLGFRILCLAAVVMVVVVGAGWQVGCYYWAIKNQPQPITLSVFKDTFALIEADSIKEFGIKGNKHTYAKLRYNY